MKSFTMSLHDLRWKIWYPGKDGQESVRVGTAGKAKKYIITVTAFGLVCECIVQFSCSHDYPCETLVTGNAICQ